MILSITLEKKSLQYLLKHTAFQKIKNSKGRRETLTLIRSGLLTRKDMSKGVQLARTWVSNPGQAAEVV